MNKTNIDTNAKYRINDLPGIANNFGDMKICSNTSRRKADLLIFLDSRGISINQPDKKGWAENIFDFFTEKKISCIMFNRIKDLTVFFTLINFIKVSGFKFKYLITNVGFVDFTPKKKSIIDDIILQKNLCYPEKKIRSQKFSKYPLLTGELAYLYSLNMFDLKNEISEFLQKNFEYSLLLGTFETDEKVRVKRKRPAEFYKQIRQTNRFLFELSAESKSIHYLQPLKYQFDNNNKISYDNVHYTESGHQKMFNIVSNVFMGNIKER